MRWAIVALTAILLAGCHGKEPRYTQEPIPVPERPELPTVPADAWMDLCRQGDRFELAGDKCPGRRYTALPVEAYADLAERDAALRGHIERLEAIIRTTHGDGAAE